MPRVSVIVPTYNSARYLTRALQSALAQVYADYEVIVADDGSTDQTREVVGQFGSKITYLYQANRGQSAARNLGLSKASGELIAYLDADDMWYPHKLETQVSFLDTRKECGLVHSDVSIIDESDQMIHRRFNRETGREVQQGYCLMDLLRFAHIQIASVVQRRDSLERTGLFDERLRNSEDYLQWILVAMDGMAIGYIDAPLALYRWRAGSVSANHRRQLEGKVMLFEILLNEKSFAVQCGKQAVNIVYANLYTLRRDLAYLDRTEGQMDHARQRIASLIREWPLKAELYLEFLKSLVPFALATKIRRFRAGLP